MQEQENLRAIKLKRYSPDRAYCYGLPNFGPEIQFTWSHQDQRWVTGYHLAYTIEEINQMEAEFAKRTDHDERMLPLLIKH